MRWLTICVLLCLVPVLSSAQEYSKEYGGTLFLTTTNAAMVSVRGAPSQTSEVVARLASGTRIAVTGISEKTDTIGGHRDYWFRISPAAKRNRVHASIGWVYGEFLNDVATIRPSRIVAKVFSPQTSQYQASLTVSVRRAGVSSEASVALTHFDDQPFYTFTWSDERKHFRYCDVPGSYVWYPKTNLVRHVTYLGDSVESAWVGFTDDLDFMFEDFGTGPGLRPLMIWYLPTGGVIFNGYHTPTLDLHDHELTVVEELEVGSYEYSDLNAATKQRVAEYVKRHPLPQAQRSSENVLVYIRLNVANGMQRFIRCRYAPPAR